jgi:ribosomal-protein-alanine N-acetyltransferase
MKYLLEGEESERLSFRTLEQTDFDAWLEFFKDPDSLRFVVMQGIGSPVDQCNEWFKRIMERYKNNLGGMNALIDKNTNKFIGQCGLLIQEVNGASEFEIGYSILPQFRNRGYASEAAMKCRDYAFENEITDSLISIIHIDNLRSEKVARKNGMIKAKQTEFKKMPVNIFRITRQDWIHLKANTTSI